MKALAQCPICQHRHAVRSAPSIDVLFGLGMAIVGLGLLVPALSQSVNYYIFTFPVCLIGVLGAYKGIRDTQSISYCSDCNHKFESSTVNESYYK